MLGNYKRTVLSEDMTASSQSNVRTLNDFLVPGMLNLSIAHVLLLLTEHCYTMQESQMLAQTILNRLLFLRSEVENKPISTRIQSDLILKYGELVGNVLQFLRRYSTKTLVARIAANRRFLEGMKAHHKRIDYFFSKVNLAQRAEMRDWESNWEQDLTLQHLLFERFLSNKLVVRAELTDRGLEEALTELKFELTKPISDQQRDFMAKVVNAFKYHHKMFSEPVPEWFVSRDEIQYKQEPFAIGTYGAVHRGSFERDKTRVVIKCMYSDSKQTQQAIYGEGELCSRLDHPNILKMKGGCYVGSPMFLLFEDAGDRRSFDFYFGDSEKNKQKLWALFLEAAEGLSYVHAKGIVHSNLKCSNLLVGVDGRTKLCDFGFSYDMNTKIVKKHTTAVRWRAPELLAPSAATPEAVVVPTFASDVYSLGMSIIEAVAGSLPWGPATSDQMIVKRATAEGYTRPSGFTDQQWKLVESLCAVKPEDRITLPEVIKELKELIRLSEGRPVESLKTCIKCSSSNPAKNKFCNECGNRFL